MTEFFCSECGNRRWVDENLVLVICGGCCGEMIRVEDSALVWGEEK